MTEDLGLTVNAEVKTSQTNVYEVSCALSDSRHVQYCKCKSASLKRLIVVAGVRPVAEDLADVTVRSFIVGTAMVGGVRWGVEHLVLGGTVFCVV